VVEDNFYTRLGTVSFLRGQPGIEVVGEAANGEAALAVHAELQPDVTVVDLRMPGVDGVQLTTALCARREDERVLVLTHYEGDEDIFRALKAGARGYLTKEAAGEDLVAAIRAVHAGKRFLPPEIAERMANRMLQPALTHREMQVLARVARGASNREIAGELALSERTVGLYVSSILGKLGARSRTEAVAIAQQRGILRAEGP
jgi:DNA-binding NarL/FixJ family response regulator